MFITPDIPPIEVLDKRGDRMDLGFLTKAEWLMDSEVKYLIGKYRGMWRLTMVYVYVKQPLQVICRIIDSYTSIKKAETYASIFQRGIRKDARGTLKADYNDINICHN